MKKVVFKILGIVIVATMLLQTVAIAASTSELKSEKSDNQEKINDAKDELSDVQEQKSNTQEEINNLDSQIADYESQINELDTKIADLNTQIEESQKKLDEAQAQYDENKKLAEERLVTMQESGDTSYLDFILSSDSVTDLISSYYLATELAQADTELLDGLEEERQAVEEAKTELENNKAELDNSRTSKESATAQLQVLKEEKNTEVAKLSEDEKTIQAQIDELTEANKTIDQQIKEAEARIAAANKNNGSSGGSGSGASAGAPSGSANLGNVSSSGFIMPVPAAYDTITTGMYYSSGAYHGAVDFGSGGINGQPIFAVADGTVIISTRVSGSYGNYIIIRHDNGLYTLYAHGQDGSRTVESGDRVSQGQQIMRVGSTGNSTGPHLHFEVRTSPGNYSNRVNPRNYLP